jgi:uncharacterized protein
MNHFVSQAPHTRMNKLLSALVILLFYAAPAGAKPLDILVYGATGEVGSLIVAEALSRGHHVAAVSRHPEEIALGDPNLEAVRGDLLDMDSVRQLVAGRDVVIEAVRGVIGDVSDPGNALQYLAAKNIVAALRETGPDRPRFIHVGGAGSLEVEPGVVYAQKLPKIALPKSLESEIIGQVWALDFLRSVTDVDWTYITPPKHFTNGERTAVFRIGGDRMMKDAHGRSRVSRADFAVAVIDEAERAEHVRQRISIAY